MVRTVKNHHQDEEEEEEEDFILKTGDGSSQKDGRRRDQKASSHRSKHSETEQRRRSKINERFQVLRDLIPENDQKRDKASFLLEVIQYIQFLQEKLQMYEGTYQGWGPEPTKLMPWRRNCGIDSFSHQSQLVNNGSIDEDNIVLTPALLTNAQNLVESDLNGSTAFKATDHGAATGAVSIDVPLQQNMLEAESAENPQGTFPDVELMASHSQPQPWNARSFSNEGAVPGCAMNELEDVKMQSEESSISNAYSKGLLNNLTVALGSLGVDLSQASISVQFDVRKGTITGATSTSCGTKDLECLSSGDQAIINSGVGNRVDDCAQARKRPRTDQNH